MILRSAGDDTKGARGLKRAEETVLEGGGALPAGAAGTPGVAMAEGSVLDGFTVTKVGLYDDASWKKHHASRGSDQEHEHIGGFGSPGVGADGVTCTIRNNIVHHNGDTGIAIRGAESKPVTPLVRDNVCFRNMGGGIGIMRGASGLVTGNTCFENFYAGIGHSGARPVVENNECFANIRAGIGISEGACPVVRQNRCYQNRRAGIGIRTGAETAPVVEDNECFENGMAGIGTDEGAAPLIRRNRCLRNEMAGIGARHDARPEIVDNECRDNKLAGIGFAECEDGRAVVRGNRVIGNRLVAIGVHAGWKVEIADNTLARGRRTPAHDHGLRRRGLHDSREHDFREWSGWSARGRHGARDRQHLRRNEGAGGRAASFRRVGPPRIGGDGEREHLQIVAARPARRGGHGDRL